MKKMILAIVALTAGYALSAQESVAEKKTSSSTNLAYSIPEPIKIRFQNAYPTAGMATWEPASGWWSATYKDENNRIIHVYYSTQPYYLMNVPDRDVISKVALPVLNTYIPESVITSAINTYGASLYSITRLTMANQADAYQVGLLENGTMRNVWLNPDTKGF